MKHSNEIKATTPSAMNYIAAMAILAFAMTMVVWVMAKKEVPPDIKPLVNVCAALLSGSAGYVWGGITLHFVWQPDSRQRVMVQAVSGAAIFLLMMWHPLYPGVAAAVTEGKGVAVRPELTISEPEDNSVVADEILVRAWTSYGDLHYYVQISGKEAGGDYIQDRELTLSDKGELTGMAHVGTWTEGAGQTYTLSIVGSREVLHAGAPPSGRRLIRSKSIVVRREEPKTEEKRSL
jgi:hypothetical protein